MVFIFLNESETDLTWRFSRFYISQYQVPQSQLAARHPPEDGLKLIRPQLGVASIESEQPGKSQCQGLLGEAGQVVV